MGLGHCLVSQEIRELIQKGVITGDNIDESRIQPASFEPTIGERLFILDTEEGLFRPKTNQTVYRALLEVPKRKRQEVDISKGFEAKKGFTYLIPLNENFNSSKRFNLIKSSPKSSSGRTFLETRVLSDYHQCFDEINTFSHDSFQMWLLLQPMAFNIILGPNLAFNQLRFFTGQSYKLSGAEIFSEWKKNPLICTKHNDNLIPLENPLINEKLRLNLDLQGKDSFGIVALRARKNSIPVDLRESAQANSEEYFEPLKAVNGELKLKPGENYLLSSKGILKIPDHLSSELGEYSHLGIRGRLHRAGFIDPNFIGDLVLEITPEEITEIILRDGMPIGDLEFFRTNKTPDKVYGNNSGSHYQGQTGPRVAKFFSEFKFEDASRNFGKLEKNVLVQETGKLREFRISNEGYEDMDEKKASELIKTINQGFFQSRYECENDSLILQPIPYALVFGDNETIFSYVRTDNIRDYGDIRLFNKPSFGLGGHIIEPDGPDYIKNCLMREVFKEEVKALGKISEPKLFGTIYCTDKPVDRVHFGLVYGFYVRGGVKMSESSIKSGAMVPISSISSHGEYESWSQKLIPFLRNFYNQIKEK